MDVLRDYNGGYGTADPSQRDRYGHTAEVVPPVFDAYAATMLETRGFEVHILDCQIRDMDIQQVLDSVAQINPDVVISRISLPSFTEDVGILSQLKSLLPTTIFVGWGTIATVYPERALSEGRLDAVIRDDFEFTVEELVTALASNNSLQGVNGISCGSSPVVHNLRKTQARSLDDLPLPAYHLMDMDAYIIKESKFQKGVQNRKTRFFSVYSSRGCPFPCIYCPYPLGFGDKIRSRSPVKAVDEIEHLVTKYGITDILFRDQVWSMDVQRSIEICDEILNRGLKIRWTCETRPDRFTKELAMKMKHSGCARVDFGVETGDSSLFRIGKPSCTLDDVEESFRIAKEAGIRRGMLLIVGLPGESWKTVKNTGNFIKRVKPDVVHMSVITPYPSTPLHDLAVKNGWIKVEDWKSYTGGEPVMDLPGFSGKDMIDARRYLLDQGILGRKIARTAQAFRNHQFRSGFMEIGAVLFDLPQEVSRVYNLIRPRRS